MQDYLHKYSQLPPSLRQRFASPAVTTAIKELENKHQVSLGVFVLKVLVKDLAWADLSRVAADYFHLAPGDAAALASDLNIKIFYGLENYFSATQAPEPMTPLTSEEEQVSAALDKANVNWPSQDLNERAKKILLTYAKGIRNKISALDALTKEQMQGGLGLAKDSADNLLKLVKGEEPAGPIVAPVVKSDKTPLIARDVEYDLAASLAARQSAPLESQLEAEEMLQPPPPAIIESLPKSEFVEPVNEAPTFKSAPAPEPIQPIVPVIPPKPVENWPRTETGKIKMTDIMGAPKVFTPVDELKYMTVKNFRNLSKDPARAVEIIKKKIDALAAEDYSKKIAGIQGWKISPLNRQYIEAYNQAMTEKKSVVAVLNKKAKDNPEFISAAEFEAIFSLNQDLKSMLH